MKLEDFGTTITGSAKDQRRRPRRRRATATVSKAKCWPLPNYQKMVDEGLPKHITYWQKKIRDKMSPYSNSVGEERYKNLTSELRTAVENVKTDEDVLNFYSKFYVENGWGEFDEKKILHCSSKVPGAYLNTALFRATAVNDIDSLKQEMEKQHFLEKIVSDGNDVSVDELLKLNIRAGEFGASMPNNERQYHLNQVYKSLCNLAIALDIPKEKVGLGLAITFGSRGSANEQAHFEPNAYLINLTRNNGAGNLAHEYGHALDCYIAKFFKQKTYASDLKHEIVDKLPAFTTLETSLFQVSGGDTRYKRNAKKIEKEHGGVGYWSSPVEMFARAFACYVKDKCIAKGIDDPYLYGQCESTEFSYPMDEERKYFNVRFDRMIEELKYWCLF